MSLHPSLKCPLPNEMVDLDGGMGGREGRVGCTLDRFRSEALVDELKGGGRRLFVELLMLLFDGLV